MTSRKRNLGPHVGFGESQTVEFKEKWVEDAMKDIVAFANTDGGTVYLGITKQGHVVPGTDVSDEHQQQIAGKIRNVLGIRADIRVEGREEHPYLALGIRRAESSTVLLRGIPWRRSGTSSFEFLREEWPALALARMGKSWDEIPADASVEEAINPDKVREFIRSAHARQRPRLSAGVKESDPTDLNLDKLGLLRDGRPTNAAILLFGRDPQRFCRHARTRVFFFRGINDFEEFPECTGTVFEQIDAAMRATAMANPGRITFPGSAATGADIMERTRRHESQPYPELALKEAITNAVVHRDYTVIGSEVEIKMYPDRIVITNPGPLLPGLTPDVLKEDPHPSRRRNPLVAEVAAMDYWIERAGTGTTRMIELCGDAGLPEPEFQDRPSGFTVVFGKDPWTKEKLIRLGMNDRQVAAVMHVKRTGQINNTQYREVTDASRPTATRDLDALVRAGVLERVGSRGAGTEYVLATASPGD